MNRNAQPKAGNELKPAIFLDRDGTLIEEVNFLSRVEDLRFFTYTDEAVKLLKEKGHLVIVVTNQSGIARGIFSEKAMHEIHESIQRNLSAKIDAFYFCPHLPNEGCRCRKPETGMIEAACADFAIDTENSWMIGDKILDVELGNKAGLKTCLVMTGYGREHSKKLETAPTVTAENLLDAVQKILAPVD
jgi:D-glycero-D-manno-heptose 1,7-bisphosphate phosphatase